VSILLLVIAAASLALLTYRRWEPRAPGIWLPMACRAVAWAGIATLLLNPGCPRAPSSNSRLVLLDGSLSMAADTAHWRAASDTARALGQVRWFGDARPWTDSLPRRGRSELGPALASAAAIGGPVVVVTDGEVDDANDIPAGLLASAGVVVMPRPPRRDLAVTDVNAPDRATVGDTLLVAVSVLLTGTDTADSATVQATLGSRVLAQAPVHLSPGAVVPVRLAVPTRRVPAGVQFLRVGLAGTPDNEPRDDGRMIATELSATPGIVLVAQPGDWDARFLYRTLREVAGLPVKGYVQLDGDRWRDMERLSLVSGADMRAAVRRADLLVLRGGEAGMASATEARGLIRWPGPGPDVDEWYVSGAPVSPVAPAFLGVPLDSLPPIAGARAIPAEAGDWVGLLVRAGRRGAPRPVIVGRQAGRRREVTIGAEGLWRWAFRGGSSGDVYRTMMAAAVSWLLAEPDRGSAEATVARRVVDQGMPVIFERTSDSTAATPVTFESGSAVRTDTLRYGGDGRAAVWLPPGVYRYRLAGSRGGSGTVAVDTWSREWLARPTAVTAHAAPAAKSGGRRPARESPWLYVVVLLGLAGEWLARRRLGLR
jgi:hypothetical protein